MGKRKQKIDETFVLVAPDLFAEKVKSRQLSLVIGHTGKAWIVSAFNPDGSKFYMSTRWRLQLRQFRSLDTCLDDLQALGITSASLSFGNFVKKVVGKKEGVQAA